MTRNTTFILTLVLGVVIWGVLFVAVEPLAQRVSAFASAKETLEQLFASANAAPSKSTESNVSAEGSPIPRLPDSLTAVVNEPFSLYYDGVVAGKEPDTFLVDISSPTLHGTAEQRRWTVTPKESDVGDHTLSVTVRDWNDAILAHQKVSLEVVSAPKLDKPIKILLVGDSLTHATDYPELLYQKLDAWAPGQIQFIGHQQENTHDACRRNESCNGWTWKLFASHYAPGQEERFALARSPFVFADDEQSTPQLDVARYLTEQGCADGVDFVIFQLGINDTFGVNLSKPDALDKSIDKMLPWADKLVNAFHEACPRASLGIALPIAFTRSSAAFEKTYRHMKQSSKSNPWRSRQIQDQLAARMLAHFKNNQQVFIIPMNSTLDILQGYSQDAGHPNRFGAQQMADAIYFAIMGRATSSQ